MTPVIPKTVADNFRFLMVECQAQISDVRAALEQGQVQAGLRVLDRSGYVDNLKMRVRDGCLKAIRKAKRSSPSGVSLRAVEAVAIELDRMTRLCRDCVQQLNGVRDGEDQTLPVHAEMLALIQDGLQLVESALNSHDVGTAVHVTKIRESVDGIYMQLFTDHNFELMKGAEPVPVVTGIIAAQRIQEMAIALQEIGDALVSSNLGQVLTAERYETLSKSVEQLRASTDAPELAVRQLAQTRSGSMISGISEAGADDGRYIAVFKDGKRRKLVEERDKVAAWNDIFPGLAPRILAYNATQDSAALLIEHLSGLTFEQILVHEDTTLLIEALAALKKTLRTVWKKTHTKKACAANHMRQLAKRMDAVYAVHGDYRNDGVTYDGLAVPSFDELVEICGAVEAGIEVPYTVRIHGDFNVDNIIYDAADKAIRFIDLHRSTEMDYVQDVAVFMVSNYRLQALDAERRRRANYVSIDFFKFARAYARKVKDDTFDLRLALALARSFATSTRFILDQSLARKMFTRSRYLLERIAEANTQKPKKFKLAAEELFFG